MKRLVILSLAAASLMPACALEFKVEANVPYHPESVLAKEGDYARAMCLIDVRYPVGVTNFATVLNFHGGGLVRGRKSGPAWPEEARNEDPVAFAWAGYRLLTNATPEQCIGDAAAAVAWTLKNISRYGGDPKKVFVTGISGGGYLTAMVGLDPKWLAPHGFKPTDLAGIAPLTGQMTKHFNMRKVGFKDMDPQFLPKIDDLAPLAHVAADLPPIISVCGQPPYEWKCRAEENRLLIASCVALGHKNAKYVELDYCDHGRAFSAGLPYLEFFIKGRLSGF